VIFALVLLVFGPRKLPEIAEAFGKSINKFKSATRTASDEVKRELDDARRSVEDDPEEESQPKRPEDS
jgi:sec-independent protein translocase protein TatA